MMTDDDSYMSVTRRLHDRYILTTPTARRPRGRKLEGLFDPKSTPQKEPLEAPTARPPRGGGTEHVTVV